MVRKSKRTTARRGTHKKRAPRRHSGRRLRKKHTRRRSRKGGAHGDNGPRLIRWCDGRSNPPCGHPHYRASRPKTFWEQASMMQGNRSKMIDREIAHLNNLPNPDPRQGEGWEIAEKANAVIRRFGNNMQAYNAWVASGRVLSHESRAFVRPELDRLTATGTSQHEL